MSYFYYNGKRSDEFGVTISGGGTYSAPVRDMEAVTIPGANGHTLLDNGRYENITVTYPGHIARGFDAKIDAFRAFMASDPGYHRLEDTYHPDEFRKAAFRSGLDPETGALNRSGRFDIVFDCRPERWLKSGERWTAPVLSCGNVAIKKPSGGGEVNSGWISTPTFKQTGSYDITLKAVPLPGHTLSELTAAMTDGTYYALYLTASASLILYDTSAILPSLVNLGEFTYTASAGETTSFHVKKVAGFEWHILVNSAEFVAGNDIEIVNPTRYNARPIVRVDMDLTGTASYRAAFTINGVNITVTDDGTLSYSTAYFDCEVGDFYALDNGQAVNLNKYLKMEDAAGQAVHVFPELVPGSNDIRFSGDTWLYYISPAVISLCPRWWTL